MTIWALIKQSKNQPAYAGVDDCLDLLVGSVGEVGERPAGVGQDVRVFVEEESGQDLKFFKFKYSH